MSISERIPTQEPPMTPILDCLGVYTHTTIRLVIFNDILRQPATCIQCFLSSIYDSLSDSEKASHTLVLSLRQLSFDMIVLEESIMRSGITRSIVDRALQSVTLNHLTYTIVTPTQAGLRTLIADSCSATTSRISMSRMSSDSDSLYKTSEYLRVCARWQIDGRIQSAFKIRRIGVTERRRGTRMLEDTSLGGSDGGEAGTDTREDRGSHRIWILIENGDWEHRYFEWSGLVRHDREQLVRSTIFLWDSYSVSDTRHGLVVTTLVLWGGYACEETRCSNSRVYGDVSHYWICTMGETMRIYAWSSCVSVDRRKFERNNHELRASYTLTGETRLEELVSYVLSGGCKEQGENHGLEDTSYWRKVQRTSLCTMQKVWYVVEMGASVYQRHVQWISGAEGIDGAIVGWEVVGSMVSGLNQVMEDRVGGSGLDLICDSHRGGHKVMWDYYLSLERLCGCDHRLVNITGVNYSGAHTLSEYTWCMDTEWVEEGGGDSMDGKRRRPMLPEGLGSRDRLSPVTHQEISDPVVIIVYAYEPSSRQTRQIEQLQLQSTPHSDTASGHETSLQMQQSELAVLRGRTKASGPDGRGLSRVIRDMMRERATMQADFLSTASRQRKLDSMTSG
ncbi:hypothetical protein Tco_1262613 [Tanacetum coccineum]